MGGFRGLWLAVLLFMVMAAGGFTFGLESVPKAEYRTRRVALAEQYRLPRPIIDFIQQHHGTTLVEYFYREAMRQQESLGNGSAEQLEPAFRYPGPKPKSRESLVPVSSGLSIASALTSMTSPLRGASNGDDASSDSTWPMRRLACSTSPRSGSSSVVISPIWSWR